MSLTISGARYNVRAMLGDLNGATYAISDERLTKVLVRHARLYRALGAPIETSTPLDAVIGSTDATLSVTAARILAVQRTSDGRMLQRIGREEIDLLLEGSGSSVPSGTPTHYALLERTGLSSTTVRFYPRPNAAESFDVWLESLTALGTTDATELEGSDYVLRAMELATAAEAAATMDDAERARIKLNPAVIPLWKTDAARFEQLERDRGGQLRDASHIPAQVN